MDGSILNNIKKMLGGITPDDSSFDVDITTHINTVFSILYQMGVINKKYAITGNTEKWSDIISDKQNLEDIKTFVLLLGKHKF